MPINLKFTLAATDLSWVLNSYILKFLLTSLLGCLRDILNRVCPTLSTLPPQSCSVHSSSSESMTASSLFRPQTSKSCFTTLFSRMSYPILQQILLALPSRYIQPLTFIYTSTAFILVPGTIILHLDYCNNLLISFPATTLPPRWSVLKTTARYFQNVSQLMPPSCSNSCNGAPFHCK